MLRAQAAGKLRVSPAKVKAWLDAGILKDFQSVSGTWKITQADFVAFAGGPPQSPLRKMRTLIQELQLGSPPTASGPRWLPGVWGRLDPDVTYDHRFIFFGSRLRSGRLK